MILAELKIHQVRTILSASLHFNDRFNFIIGPNGSGKTSILESLYLLSCGHSFRSREIASIVSFNQEQLTVFARGQDNSTVSIQKSKALPTQIKRNNQFCSTTSQLAYALPCQIVYADIFQIIDAGSAVRRAVLDWGLFHVEPNYLGLWKEYKRVLKQRNALLKQNSIYAHFVPWDRQLSVLADQIDTMRRDYFTVWREKFLEVLAAITPTHCNINYYKGWDRRQTGKSLETILQEQFTSDKQRQYTQYGAHHADIVIETNETKAKQTLSRGQQKIILIALKLAQGELLNDGCLYLFDDLPSELDETHQQKLIQFLIAHKGQYVITATSNLPSSLLIPDNHVKSFKILSGSVEDHVSRET